MIHSDDAFSKLSADYSMITGFSLNRRVTNRIEDRVHRRDREFSGLAYFFFDHQDRIPLMKIKLAYHMAKHETELSCALMAYVHYICEEFNEALPLFFKCITMNPENLDNWFDCAFCLHHLENEYAYHIIYNYDEFMRLYGEMQLSRCDLPALHRIYKRILDEKCGYTEHMKEYHQFLTSREGRLTDYLPSP
ncbi:MAG: hypothetical protein AB2L14_30545 [Candidatus Xenobiia bacterium LiM19]